eukprot:scaffold1525_cov142-Cylindrotheca_fusiformis.AAC.171
METRTSFQNPIDLSSSEDLSYNVNNYRAELLSDGYIMENDRNGIIELARGQEDVRDSAPNDAQTPWYRPDFQDSGNVANVFRRFLGGALPPKPTMATRAPTKHSPSRLPLFQNSMLETLTEESSVDTKVMGSTRGSIDQSEINSSTGSSQRSYHRPKPPRPEGRSRGVVSPVSGAKATNSIVAGSNSVITAPSSVLATLNSVDTGENKPYGWRLDPKESFSDWEIRIVTESGKICNYNVHRMALAAGPRKSEYFVNLFGNQVSNFKSQRLRLEMPDESAEVFPVFLDFVYGEDDLESVEEKEQAYAVYEQAEFFGTPLLKTAVTNWCEKRLSWDNVPEFLSELDRFEDADPLVRMAVDLCAANFEDLGTDFGTQIEPRYLTMILERLLERNFDFDRSVDYVSEMLLTSCKEREDMDEASFLKLTDIRFLPTAPVEAVMRLAAAEAKFCEPSDEPTTLQIRCILALSENWEYFSFQFPTKEEMSAAMLTFPKHVMAQLLVLTTDLP